MRCLLLAIFLITPLALSCGKQDGREPAPAKEALLTSDTGYAFLLERNRLDETVDEPQSPEYILIYGRDIRHFSGVNSPAMSRRGHFVAVNDKGEIVVYYPDEENPYTLNSPDINKTEIFSGGFGVAPNGKRVFRIAVDRVDDEGEIIYRGSLIEFDLSLRRDSKVTTLFEFDEEGFEFNKEILLKGLSYPLHLSESGDKVFYNLMEFETDEQASEPGAGDTVPIEGLPKMKVRSNFQLYDKEDDCLDLWLDTLGLAYSSINQVGTSAHGNCTLYIGTVDGGDEFLLLQKGTGEGERPEVIATEKPGQVNHPRLSPEGGRVGYFRKKYGADWVITEAVVIHTAVDREDVMLRLKDVSDTYWSDDLKYVAYFSNSFQSSLVIKGKEPHLHKGESCYLHLVEVNELDDMVVCNGGDESGLRFVDILATPDEFRDRTDDKPLAFGTSHSNKKSSSQSRKRKKAHKPTGETPSVTSD